MWKLEGREYRRSEFWRFLVLKNQTIRLADTPKVKWKAYKNQGYPIYCDARTSTLYAVIK